MSEITEVDDQTSVSIEGVHVRFRVTEDRDLRLSDLARRGFRSRRSTEVYALRGVTTQIRVGESVGIVGHNGSGKSTLLRCIAGVQPLERGRVLVRGQPQLLAVNAALDANLSGRRNIYLGALAMGLTRREVDHGVEAVVEFAELGDAINRPLRTYSSGMKARLAFSIATMVAPPILLIDEALAVGDRNFRNKSLRRLREMQSQAGTLVMVSHNMNEIRYSCDRSIWIDQGVIRADGPTDEVIETYEAATTNEAAG